MKYMENLSHLYNQIKVKQLSATSITEHQSIRLFKAILFDS